MQNWSPEPFTTDIQTAPVVPATADTAFRGEAVSAGGSGDAHQFRREAGFTDANTILEHMSQQERAVVFELVEIDVAKTYTQREEELRRELEEKYAADLAEVREATAGWMEKFTAHRDARLREMSAASARLALEVASKILRARIEAAPETLTRTIEAALHMANEVEKVTVTVAPEDAALLEENEDLCQRLGIVRVVADRRVTRGGCLIAADGREWNATLEGQLSTIGEVVEEWIATEGSPSQTDEGKDPLDPAVE